MILTNAGPLIALLTPSDPYHARCTALTRNLQSEAMLTTWVCFTEAMYFLGETGRVPPSGCSLEPATQRQVGVTYPL